VNQFVRGNPITNAPESIKLFVLCSSMRWNHLPVAGGIYDQHPRLIDEWQVIFEAQARQREKEQAEQDAKAKNARRSKA
jgi:hypothetical protein